MKRRTKRTPRDGVLPGEVKCYLLRKAIVAEFQVPRLNFCPYIRVFTAELGRH